ncbi:histidine phosphatase family protein [Microbacterium sp. HJ5]
MALGELWLVRHGESVGNVAATQAQRDGLDVIPLDIRDADVPLSPTGEEQATALGGWLERHRDGIDVSWTSPYLRARQTLDLARAQSGDAPAFIDERLRDRELGVLDLLTRHGVTRLHPEESARRLHLGKFYHRPPGGESWADVALRLRSFLRDALEAPGDGALIVAHDAVVMLFLYVLLPLREDELLDFAVEHTVLNASVTHLVRDGSGWRLEAFADVAHLTREGAEVTAHPGDGNVQPR